MVDGTPNHEMMVRLALDCSPEFPHRRGPYVTAAKWFLRRFEDATVTRVPSDEEVAAVESALPGVTVALHVATGDTLSELAQQDSYSYELADLFVGAADEATLKQSTSGH